MICHHCKKEIDTYAEGARVQISLLAQTGQMNVTVEGVKIDFHKKCFVEISGPEYVDIMERAVEPPKPVGEEPAEKHLDTHACIRCCALFRSKCHLTTICEKCRWQMNKGS